MITSTTSSTGATTATDTSSNTTLAGGAMGKNEFLKLLVAQLQHQDPMNPMQGDQMASQLAQFSSLEQLQQINSALTGQQTASSSLLGAVQATAAINTIGHTVLAAGDGVHIGGPDGSSSVTASFAGSGTATLHIYNSAGTEVGTREIGAVTSGKHTVPLGDAAKGLSEGDYTYSIDVKDADGNAVDVQTYMAGKVTGVSSGTSGVVLQVNGREIPYSSVIQVN